MLKLRHLKNLYNIVPCQLFWKITRIVYIAYKILICAPRIIFDFTTDCLALKHQFYTYSEQFDIYRVTWQKDWNIEILCLLCIVYCVLRLCFLTCVVLKIFLVWSGCFKLENWSSTPYLLICFVGIDFDRLEKHLTGFFAVRT